ncbi:MAG: mechanosensitive ion channel [Hyphomonadaceae bacterium]|nr:MAG: mscS [Caulobacteraceae bacterium]MBT9445702.1 mechanosensitive ion channel [Hyphomonadaceae bacterium]TPW08349.1 MAG: mscS [Alphaproteobacteria bacterium]
MPPTPAALTDFSPRAIWEHYGDAVIAGAFNLVAALAILIAGVWITRWLAAAVNRIARKHSRIDNTLAAFFASIVRYGLLAFVVIAVLDRFGVQTTQIIAVLGAATLAIGLALQGTLSNVAAGVMLVLFRPYRLGDFVEVAGQKGTVRDINLFITELSTPANVQVTLPNAQCWGAPILNYSVNGTRMLDLTFSVSYKADLDAATRVVLGVVAGDARVLKEPSPFVKVSALGDYSVTLLANLWCRTADILHLKLDLTKAVKDALDDAGIDIPYPTNVTYHIDAGHPGATSDGARRDRISAAHVTSRPDDEADS